MDFDNSFLSEKDTTAAHEDALVFELKGQPIGWRASGLALQRASDQGMEVGELLADLQALFGADIDEEDLDDLDEEEVQQLLEEELEMQGGVADFLSILAKLIWVGALHFEPNAKRETILAILDSEAAEDVPVDHMLGKIFPALDDGLSGEDDSGKGQGETKTKSPR